jgi:hypothetical protein
MGHGFALVPHDGPPSEALATAAATLALGAATATAALAEEEAVPDATGATTPGGDAALAEVAGSVPAGFLLSQAKHGIVAIPAAKKNVRMRMPQMTLPDF